MSAEQDETAALAGTIEMLNAAFPRSAPWNENSYISIDALPELFVRRDQQHTAELARRSGKMPTIDPSDCFTPPKNVCDAVEVFEAIAAMQAQIEQLQDELKHTEECCVKWAEDFGNTLRKLEQSEARVAELEKIIEHNLNAMRP